MIYSEAQGPRPRVPSPQEHAEFEGFAPLQSNTTYCPNQFFDVVLPDFPRGVVRLVGYAIYRTLGWSDRDGRPMSEQHKVSYRELIEKAGISRGALKEAIDRAIRGNLLQCVQQGRPSQAGADAESNVFELRSYDGEYSTDPTLFQDFLEGAGNRIHIANQFSPCDRRRNAHRGCDPAGSHFRTIRPSFERVSMRSIHCASLSTRITTRTNRPCLSSNDHSSRCLSSSFAFRPLQPIPLIRFRAIR